MLNEKPDVEIPNAPGDLRTEILVTLGFNVLQPQRQTTLSPAPYGVSAGQRNIIVGTIGCLVEIAKTRYLLSNNHVPAESKRARRRTSTPV